MEEITDFEIIGIPHLYSSTSMHALIEVTGYVNSNGIYIPIKKKDAKEIFVPHGEVFAFNFFKKYKDLENSAISFSIKYKEDIYDKDFYTRYTLDLSKDTESFGEDAYIYPGGCISLTDAEKNNQFAEKHKFTTGLHYAVCNDNLFRFTQESYIERWNMQGVTFREQNKTNVLYVNNKYVILSEPIGKPTLVDKMSNEALMCWFFKYILPDRYPDLSPLLKSISMSELILSIQPLNESQRIMNDRLAKALDLLENVDITKKRLEDFAKSPLFSDIVHEAIKKHEQEYVKDFETKYTNELKELEGKKQKFLSDIDILTLNYKTEEEKIKKLEIRKDSIISDFQIIKDVLSYGTNLEVKSANKDDRLEGTSKTVFQSEKITRSSRDLEFINSQSSPLTDYFDFQDNVHAYTQRFGLNVSMSKITSLLADYKMLLVPDARIAYAIVKATERCYTTTAYVGIDWQSFKNLWESGLSDILQSSLQHPDVMHYLVIQNINLSYLPSYLQPLLDVIAGYTEYFPGTPICFPDNLKIISTIIAEKGIPLSESCLRMIGCYPKEKVSEIPKVLDNYKNIGYLSPEVLNAAADNAEESDYQSYLETNANE